jgi:ATP phosphoribosyltransferase regulatory subunit
MIKADPRAEALVAVYERDGYRRIEPDILQPAEPFLELSGEELRQRMYLTADENGGECCLRPELTIPVACEYLKSSDAGKPSEFCYLGRIFRYRGQEADEFLQGGIESFGREDRYVADADMLTLGLEAVSNYGIEAPDIQIGDIALFSDLVAALNLTPMWRRRLIKDFGRKRTLAHDMHLLTKQPEQPEFRSELGALGADHTLSRRLIKNLLSADGIKPIGGRSLDEIIDRFLEQEAMDAAASLPQEKSLLLQRFLNIVGDPNRAAADLRALMRDAGITLDAALEGFETRTHILAGRGVDVCRIRFSTAFARKFDYYTGFLFEIHDPLQRVSDELVGGGRYDGLLTRLGSSHAIPAVGFAIWVERLANCASRA